MKQSNRILLRDLRFNLVILAALFGLLLWLDAAWWVYLAVFFGWLAGCGESHKDAVASEVNRRQLDGD